MNFNHKIVLITGAAGGIGKSIAMAFAEKGARIALHYYSNQQGAERTLHELSGVEHHLFQADISKPVEVLKLIMDVVETFGTIDILINNAAAILTHPIDTTDYKEWNDAWDQSLNINLKAAANLSFCAIQHMKNNGGGRIVNVSSRGAFRGEPDMPAYGASKAGLNALSQSLALAVAKHNIFIGTVAPGFVDTKRIAPFLEGEKGKAIRAQSPLNRVAMKEEVAHAVLFLASEGAEFTTGTIIDVNGASYLRS